MRENEYIEIIKCLANGTDPITGEIFPSHSPYQQAEIIRALFYAVQELKPKREQIGNQGKLWSREEDNTLSERFNKGAKISEIAKAHERTYGAIKSRLIKLKLIEE